ncbi:nucleoside 2-deoxyribosyltransferase [Mammaliicoccus sciuri]|uniref:nucleoside 2-deoxyribosyltransferase n=1 Tax=Mammaliicoccus sciuri TaxID=1296 RepID=UPI002B25D847|nr:nucleoside 2-deoxyribosyltransferase [Mammaliicoccus sciuri]WQK60571.1 nucleoside 2-deoxyribosyltransferase [Mammaliicoccus sciuri]
MGIKFYVAGSFGNKNVVNKLIKSLEQHGLQNTYNWTLNDKAINKEDLRKIGQSEAGAVKNSDILLAILPGGKGTYTEIGIAIGHNKPILLLAQNEKIFEADNAATFYFLENVYRKQLDRVDVYEEVVGIIASVK